jgi:ubiquinol-cytochrome c reductase cytochrome c1 subunit
MKSKRWWKPAIASFLISTCCLWQVGAVTASAGETGVVRPREWDRVPVGSDNPASLQNGARQYLQSCVGCHSAAYMHYGQLRDIGLDMEEIRSLLPPENPPQSADAMQSAITAQQGMEWFGTAPPDLTLMTRSRGNATRNGADFVYTYLRSFYRDPDARSGWNNVVAPDTAMPHVLSALQGDGETTPSPAGTREQGRLSPAEYDKRVADIVHFMQWMAEPGQSRRQKIGWFVCLFFAAFAAVAWRLHASYWKNIQ